MSPQDYYRTKALSKTSAGLYGDEYNEKPTEKLLQLYIEGKRPYAPFHLVTSDHHAGIDRMESFVKILESKKLEGKISEKEMKFLDYLLEMIEFRKDYDNAPTLQILKEDLPYLYPKVAKIKEWVRGLVAKKAV